MRRTCIDPECPANRQIASTSKPPKSKHKKGRPLCHKNCPTSSRTSIKPRKRSKCARSKKRSKERSTSKIKYCKNKKCQASKQYVESSTSVHVPEKICVSSKDSVRLCTSKLPCKDPRPGKRTACNCRPRQSVPEKKPWRSKQHSRQRKILAPLCICVRTSSVDTFRRDTCPILAKYGECCCRRHRRKRSKRNETSMTPRRDSGTKRKCHCRPPSRNQQNIFIRGLSFFRRKMPKFKRTSNNPKPNSRPRPRSYPAENCASRSCLKNRNKRSSERRKVKFYK